MQQLAETGQPDHPIGGEMARQARMAARHVLDFFQDTHGTRRTVLGRAFVASRADGTCPGPSRSSPGICINCLLTQCRVRSEVGSVVKNYLMLSFVVGAWWPC